MQREVLWRKSTGIPGGRVATLAVLVALLFCADLSAQVIDPDFTLHFTPGVTGSSGSVQTVECLLDVWPTGEPLAGWSLGVCHDDTIVAPVATAPGPALATMNNGFPVAFDATEFEVSLGVTQGVVICFTTCAPLNPPLTNLVLVSIDYSLIGAHGATTELLYCNTVAISGNPVPTLLVTQAAGSRIPVTDPGPVSIINIAFRRADCDADGLVTISDAVTLLSVLFGPVDTLTCHDSCDSTDDGVLNITDPIHLLGYLFTSSAAPPPPFPDCGPDPTPDPLECGLSTVGC